MRSAEFCPECARPADDRADRRRAVCPHCGTSLSGDQPARWTNVARVTNLAEAGFLVDELAGEGLETRIYQTEEFSALVDRWLVSYLIQSPPDAAQAAAARIRQHLAEIDSYQDPADAWTDSLPAVEPLFWRPVAVVLLAGMAGFALGQRFAVDLEPPRPPRGSLAAEMAALGRPLMTEPDARLPRHRLYYHRREQAWYLETDANADGRFEAQQRFHAAGMRW